MNSVSCGSRVDKDKWIFSVEKLRNSPSFRDGYDNEKELHYRQQAANFIQDMGQKLQLNQLCINTGIVYMHRFYMINSFKKFHRYAISPACIFLAAKVEEQPKKLEQVLKVCHSCLSPTKGELKVPSDEYNKQSSDLQKNELSVLECLDFDVSVDHPHTHVVKCTQLVKVTREFAQMAYFMATNSLHLTAFGVLYRPTVVAAMCIYLSCRWSKVEIPLSSDGKPFWAYMDDQITEPLLKRITEEFVKILTKYPTRLNKLKNYRPKEGNGSGEGPRIRELTGHGHPTSAGGSKPNPDGKRLAIASANQIDPKLKMETKKSSISIEDYKKKLQASGNGGQKLSAAAAGKYPVPNAMSAANQVAPRPNHSRSAMPPPPKAAGDNNKLGNEAHRHHNHHHRANHEMWQQQQHHRQQQPTADKNRLMAVRPSDSLKDARTVDVRTFDSRIMAEMYAHEPERLRKFLKHVLPHTRKLATEEKDCLVRLEKKNEENARRRAAAKQQQMMQQQQQNPSSLKIKIAPAQPPSAGSVSSTMMMSNPAQQQQQTRKRPHDASSSAAAMPHPEKYARRADEQASRANRHGKDHHHHHRAQMPVNQSSSSSSSHRPSYHKHSQNMSSYRPAPSQQQQQQLPEEKRTHQ